MELELTLLPRVAYRGREVTGARIPGLLALLTTDLRAGCSTGRLLDGLWPDGQPQNPLKALQILVSRARSQLGAEVIATTATGYRLTLAEDQVDGSALLLKAAACAWQARAGDHAAALAHAESGLGLWHPAGAEAAQGAELGPDALSQLRADRAAVYRSLQRSRALALSRLGRAAEAVQPLTELSAHWPRDEELLLELLRCEAATAGPAAALARYDAYRRRLRAELGTDPGAALRELHLQLLRGQAPPVRRGLAAEPNRLLGRDDDLAAVAELLRGSRVTSIVGAGGLGKTRLAQAVARRAELPTVHLVGLAGTGRDEDVADAVASALGLPESWRAPGGAATAPRDVSAGLAAALSAGPALLVLDNCEHVLRGAADLVHGLISAAPQLRVLTTSRSPLGLSAERVYPLPELPLDTAVELFGERARTARPRVELPIDVVTELCRHLDGLPLAVELAAARVRALSVPEIARRLDDRFALLRGAARDAPARHQTLHAVVDWSWHLLGPAEQAAMRALSVFPAGFTPDAAQQLLGGEAVLGTLEQLTDQSLLKVIETPSGTRLRMLETVREFSVRKRDEAGETARATAGFLAWARAFGNTEQDALTWADPFLGSQRARAEEENLVQALRTAVADEDLDTVAATAAVLSALWTVHAAYVRLSALADDIAWPLSHYRPGPELVDATRTAVTLSALNLVMIRGALPLRALVTVLRLPPGRPDTPVGAIAGVLTALLRSGGDPAPLAALCEHPEPMLAAVANGFASYLWQAEGAPEPALAAARRMRARLAQTDAQWLRALAHGRIGELLMLREDGAAARQEFEAALRIMQQFEQWSDVLGVHWALVLANLQAGDVPEAERWLELAEQEGPVDSYGSVSALLAVRAEVQLARGETDAGLRRWRRAVEQRAESTDPAFRLEGAGLEPWALHLDSGAVAAHAHAGRLDLVADLVDELPGLLATMLTSGGAGAASVLLEVPACGALLLALGLADLVRAADAGDPRLAGSGARMVALAERFEFVRDFQPTMSSARARRRAEQAAAAEYAEAVSAYRRLGRDQLRAAALAALRERDQLTAGRDGSRLNSFLAQR